MAKKIVIKDFLDEESFSNLQSQFESNRVLWEHVDGVVEEDNTDFQFVSPIWSPYVGIMADQETWAYVGDVLELLDMDVLVRAKANLRTKTATHEESQYHTDEGVTGGLTGIYYINTNNGYTKFEDGDIVKSVENTMVIFPNHLKHCGGSSTDTNRRLVLNINWIPMKESTKFSEIC